MYCIHKAGGWQPKAAGGWFALLTILINLVIIKALIILIKRAK
jgi:hypothetical protein